MLLLITHTELNLNEHFGSNTLKVNGRYLIISISCFISLITKLCNISQVSSKNIYTMYYISILLGRSLLYIGNYRGFHVKHVIFIILLEVP